MLTQEQLKQYEESGFIIFEDLFDEKEIDELRERLDKYDEEYERFLRTNGAQWINIPNQITFRANTNLIDPYVQKFACQQKFVDISTALLGPDIQLYWDQSVYKKPEAKRDFPWHQDNGYAPIEPRHYLTCWLALTDATIENGCVWVMPESHKQGVVEHKETITGLLCYFGENPGLAVPLKKGSMVAFSSLLFHRSTPNLSQDVRKAYIMQYSHAGAKNPETGQVYANGPVLARDGKCVYVPTV
ncbi:phytanoyl-CoA dioxygenase family protein [Paenibacillus montanisoli]|uniref:Phytanoyl-CoA dioxygenase family protein n=1 Tax=Paenibacillus montanisoli TaxID=2081970 RepID=A0A328U7T1_9BACL|nr:phytanoyl-CoA dioxygenase family protein [Paenibacillus montanisoli]RAP78530.1 hypothetical protein DL346_08945 [Paenibacillus montanisoli]